MTLPINSPVTPTPISDFEPEVQKSPEELSQLMEVFEVATPASRDEILARLEKDYAGGEMEARSLTMGQLGTAGALVDGAIQSGQDPQSLRYALSSLTHKQDEISRSKATLSGYLAANSPGSTESDIRFANNREMMSRKLNEKLKSFDQQGWLGTGWDFMDRYIGRMVPQTYEDLTDRTGRLGRELIDIAALDPEDAEKAFENYLTGIGEEGILTGNNYFAYQQALRELDSMGYNRDAGFDAVLAGIDVTTGFTASGAANLARKAARAATSKVSKVASFQGPVKGGEVAENLITKQDDVEAIVDAGTDLINPRSVRVTGPMSGSFDYTPPSGAANAADRTYDDLTFRERLSRFTIKQVEDAIKRIPDADLSAGLSEANLLKIERALGTNRPSEQEINSFFAGRPSATTGNVTVTGTGITTFRGTPTTAANEVGARYDDMNFRERLSRFSVSEVEEALKRIPAAKFEDGLSDENVKLIENALQASSLDEDTFFASFRMGNPIDGGDSIVTTAPGITLRSQDSPFLHTGAYDQPANSPGVPVTAGAANSPVRPTRKVVTSVSGPTVNVTVPPVGASVPPVPTAAKAIQTRSLTAKIEELKKKGWMGQDIDEGALAERANKIVDAYQKRTARPIFNSFVRTPMFEDHIAVAQFGDTEGKPFLDAGSADKYGKSLLQPLDRASYDIVQVDPLDETKGFVVQFEERVKKAGAADAIDTSLNINPLKRILGRTVASSSATDDPRNYVRASQGEAEYTKVMAMAGDYAKVINKVSADSRWTIDQVLRNLRDGPDADVLDYYSPAEFSQKFMQIHPEHRLPTEAEQDAWAAVVSLDDADYFMSASRLLNKFVESGFKAISYNDGSRYIAKKVNVQDIPSNSNILEIGQRTFTKDQLQQVPDKASNVWLLSTGLGTKGDIHYIVNPDKVGILHYEDVLGRNAGGRRVYREKYFVAVEGPGGAAAKLTAKTEKEAKLATKQIQTIFDAIKNGSPNLDDIIKQNNDWNPGIADETSFRKWATDYNVDLDGRVAYKADSGVLSGADQLPGMPSLTWAERITMQQSRSNEAIPSFGGGLANVEDPLSAIGQHFSTAAHMLTNSAAIRQGVDSWVRGVLEATDSSGWEIPSDAIASGDYSRMFREAKMQGGRTELQEKFNDLRNIIDNRHNITQAMSTDKWIERNTQALGEWILDADTGGKKALLNNAPMRYLGGRIVEADSVHNNLLKMGFGATFGFFNFAQFAVQAVHGAVMIPIIGQTGPAAKALFLQPAIRAASASWGTATGRELTKRLAKTMGVPNKDIDDLITYIQQSGRMVVGQEALELGTLAGTGITRSGGVHAPPSALNAAMQKAGDITSRVYDSSFVFYRAGEKFSRLSSTSTAFFEYKKAFPNGDPLSASGKEWIMQRDQALSFHMTNAGRANWQQGLGRFPTQWLAYSFRSAESIFFGREFSKIERAKLAFAVTALWGANGFGQEWIADWGGEQFGIEPDSPFYTALKFGILDGILDGADVNISLGDRLAPFKGITDLWSDAGDATALETLVGPSGTIVGNGVSALWGTMSNLLSGQTAFAKEDFERALRTVSSVDALAKMRDILKFGYLRTKTGYKYEAGVEEADALIIAMGFSPTQIAEENSRRSRSFKDNKESQAFRKKISTIADKAFSLVELEDEDSKQAGFALLRDIDLELQTSNLSAYEQQRLRRSLMTEKQGTITRLHQTLLQQDKAYAARALAVRTNQGN